MKDIPPDVVIHDTTLREGEQTPGVVFNIDGKLAIARKLDEVGIQQLESGFPAASPGEREAVSAIVSEGLKAKIFGFARAVHADIDAVAETGASGIVISFPPSDTQLKYKLKMTREQYLEKAVEAVEHAKGYGLYISYSAEDSTRTDIEFLKKTFATVIEAGVDRARIVDTLGVGTPVTIRNLVYSIRQVVNAPIEIHCHNDHGLAVANTIAAFEAGATALSTCANGLGERTGVAATEEVIICLHNLYGVQIYNTTKLSELCRMIEELSKVSLPANKPVIGDNVFVHTSGIHQHAVLQNPVTYEPYPPELVGQKRRLLLGKLTGTHAVKAKLQEVGYDLPEDKVKEVVAQVKMKSEERSSALSDAEFLEILRNLR